MKLIQKFHCIGLASLAAFALSAAFGQTTLNISRNPELRTLPKLADIHLSGELGTRYQAATCNLLTRADRYSLETFRADAVGDLGPLWPDWPGDQIGRYLSVLHVAYQSGWTPAATQRAEILNIVLPLQRQSGNFGSENPDGKDVQVISGNAFALRGLLDSYEDTRDEQALAAARRIARFFEANYAFYKERGREGSVHEFYGHCLDGLVRLYELGGDQWALEFARQIGSRAGLTAHTHHSLSLYRGVMDLYRLTGEKDYLRRTVAYLGWVRSVRAVTGGVPESMPSYHEDEGCALSDYVVLNLQVFAATGRDEFLEEAENTLVNHFFMNQFHTGGFGHRGFAQEVVGGKDWQGWEGKFGSENPGCCSMWGQWGLANVGQYVLTRHGEILEANLYPAAEISFPDLETRVEIQSDFPRMKQASLTVYNKKDQILELRLRVPRWADEATVEVNGSKASPQTVDRRVALRRKWHSGDTVRIQFKSSLRLVHWPLSDSPLAGVFEGPLCLGLSSADGNVDADWRIATSADGKLVLNSSGQPTILDDKGEASVRLRPIADDWLAPDVLNPHRIRVLFRTKLMP